MKKTATAAWSGDLKTGKGTISTQSGALKNQPYGFNTRFGDTPGTNPEELLGAAHAGCFTMALSNILGEAGLTAQSLDTKAEVTLDKVEGLCHHRRPPDRGSSDSRRQRPGLRGCRAQGRKGLPGLQGAQRQDHHGRQAQGLNGRGRPAARAAPLARPIPRLLKINLTVMPEKWKMRTILRKSP